MYIVVLLASCWKSENCNRVISFQFFLHILYDFILVSVLCVFFYKKSDWVNLHFDLFGFNYQPQWISPFLLEYISALYIAVRNNGKWVIYNIHTCLYIDWIITSMQAEIEIFHRTWRRTSKIQFSDQVNRFVR